MSNINFAAIKVDRDNQAIFIPADVENDPVLYFVRGGKNGSQLSKTVKIGLFHNFEPSCKACLTVRMFLPELNQGFARDDMHIVSLSQVEMFCNPPIFAFYRNCFANPFQNPSLSPGTKGL